MNSLHTTTKARRGLAVVGASVALIAGLSANAHAYDTNDNDIATLSPSSSSYSDNAVVTVTVPASAGLSPNTAYIVGQCEYVTYTITGGGKAPACGNQTTATTNGSGVLTKSYTLKNSAVNLHAFLGGSQPANLNCGANLCEVLVSPAHGGGGGGSNLADSAEFNVTP